MATTFGSKKKIAEDYVKENPDSKNLDIDTYLTIVSKMIELQIEQERNELIESAVRVFCTQVEYHTGKSIRL